MLDRSKKRARDPNQLAHQVFLESIGEVPKFDPVQQTPAAPDPSKNPHAVALGRLGGLTGGAARTAQLTPKKRSQIAGESCEESMEQETKMNLPYLIIGGLALGFLGMIYDKRDKILIVLRQIQANQDTQ